MNQLKFILPDLDANKDKGANFLIKGPSGFGKTRMAKAICDYLAGKHYQFFLGESSRFSFVKRVVFIDEIHTVANLERFYPVMDTKTHVFVFATNHDATLPEAFVNRCYEFVFDDYSDDELLLMVREYIKFPATDTQLMEIINAGNRNPRIILESLCDRLVIYFRENKISDTSAIDFRQLILDIFRIDDGLDTLCKRYIEVLKSLGGRASFNLIKTLLHTDEDSIKNNVEPILIRKKILEITSKGRSLINNG